MKDRYEHNITGYILATKYGPNPFEPDDGDLENKK